MVAGILLLASSTVHGEITVVSPPEFENVEADGVSDGAANLPDGFRIQTVFASSDFESLVGSKLLIGYRLRPDASLTSSFSRSWPRLLLKLSVTDMDPADLDPTFTNNVGSRETVVYDDPIAWSTANEGPPSGPREFGDYGVDFETPFRYDPAEGNLLMDWYVPGPVGDLNYDVALGVGAVSGGSVFSLQSESLVGSRTDDAAVTQFIFVPKPETLMLALLGLMILSAWGWRKKWSC